MDQTIWLALQATQKHFPGHFNTLIGEREKGSTWGRHFTLTDFGLPWRETKSDETAVAVRRPGFQYFKLDSCRAYFPNAQIGALPLTTLFGGVEVEKVYVEPSHHGAKDEWTFCIRREELGLLKDHDLDELTDEAWLIIGTEVLEGGEEARVIQTVYPGPLMLDAPKGVEPPVPRECWDNKLPVAVKVI